MRRTGAAIAATALAWGALAGTAGAVGGTVEDRQGDAELPAQDIRAVAVNYDPQGIITGSVTTQAPAFSPNVEIISLKLGTASTATGQCNIALDIGMITRKEVDDIDAFGVLRLDGRELREQALVQEGPALRVNTADGDGEGGGQGPSPELANKPWNCAVAVTYGPKTERDGNTYVIDDESRVFPLTANPAAMPVCEVLSRKVRRGRRARVRCANVTGPVTVRFHRRRKARAKQGQVGPDGRLAVSTRGLRRGEHFVSVWQGTTLVGQGAVRVR